MPYLETVQELLEAKEGEHVQFKEAKNRFDFGEAAKCCCALANNGGGKLVFGITDKRPRSVVGSAAFDQPERTRMGLIEKLKVNVDFQLFNYERKRVLVFDVKSRPIGLPVQYDGVAWIYEGDTLKPMPEDMRRSIYEETGGDFSGTICAGATVDDLDETAIENFRAKWIEKSGKKQLATLSKQQLLHDCGAITDEGVTYAALILFGKNAAIIKYLPQAEIILSIVPPKRLVRQIREKSLRSASSLAMTACGSLSICETTSSTIRKAFSYLTLRPSMSALSEKRS